MRLARPQPWPSLQSLQSLPWAATPARHTRPRSSLDERWVRIWAVSRGGQQDGRGHGRGHGHGQHELPVQRHKSHMAHAPDPTAPLFQCQRRQFATARAPSYTEAPADETRNVEGRPLSPRPRQRTRASVPLSEFAHDTLDYREGPNRKPSSASPGSRPLWSVVGKASAAEPGKQFRGGPELSRTPHAGPELRKPHGQGMTRTKRRNERKIITQIYWRAMGAGKIAPQTTPEEFRQMLVEADVTPEVYASRLPELPAELQQAQQEGPRPTRAPGPMDIAIRETAHLEAQRRLDLSKPRGVYPNSLRAGAPPAIEVPIVRLPREEPPSDASQWTFQVLLEESDVFRNPGEAVLEQERIVDKPRYSQDLSLWSNLLGFRQRLDGHAGVWRVFCGMRARNTNLPTQGLYAERFWEPILKAAVALHKIDEILKYATNLHRQHGTIYEGFYLTVMRSLLLQDRSRVLETHQRLSRLQLPPTSIINQLATSLTLDKTISRNLRYLYREVNYQAFVGRGEAYSTIVSKLCAMQEYREAVAWHFDLVRRGELPKHRDLVLPLVEWAKASLNKRLILKLHQSLAGIVWQDDANIQSVKTITSPETALAKVDDRIGDDVRGDYVSDDFTARAFATELFSPNFVIKSLRAFGFTHIGPLALQELARKCRRDVARYQPDDPNPGQLLVKEVSAQLDQMHSLGIDLTRSKYCDLVLQLVRDGHGGMLASILSSDLHPDTYDDDELQRRLLRLYLFSEDWPQVSRTLAVLTVGQQRPPENALNRLLVAFLGPEQAGTSGALSVGAMMMQNNIPLSVEALRQTRDVVGIKKGPPRRNLDPKERRSLKLIAKIWLEFLGQGVHIPISSWRQVITRFGMAGMLDDLRKVCGWLAYYYGQRSKPANARYRELNESQLNLTFSPLMQRAVVEWHFLPLHMYDRLRIRRAVTGSDGQAKLPQYARGLAVVAAMAGQAGLRLDIDGIRTTVSRRLGILFGVHLLTSRRSRASRTRQHLNLFDTLTCLDRAWRPARHGPLFGAAVAQLLVDYRLAKSVSDRLVVRQALLQAVVPKRSLRERTAEQAQRIAQGNAGTQWPSAATAAVVNSLSKQRALAGAEDAAQQAAAATNARATFPFGIDGDGESTYGSQAETPLAPPSPIPRTARRRRRLGFRFRLGDEATVGRRDLAGDLSGV